MRQFSRDLVKYKINFRIYNFVRFNLFLVTVNRQLYKMTYIDLHTLLELFFILFTFSYVLSVFCTFWQKISWCIVSELLRYVFKFDHMFLLIAKELSRDIFIYSNEFSVEIIQFCLLFPVKLAMHVLIAGSDRLSFRFKVILKCWRPS